MNAVNNFVTFKLIYDRDTEFILITIAEFNELTRDLLPRIPVLFACRIAKQMSIIKNNLNGQQKIIKISIQTMLKKQAFVNL